MGAWNPGICTVAAELVSAKQMSKENERRWYTLVDFLVNHHSGHTSYKVI